VSFEISARTILQLGAELISSDAVAIYELIKNAVDAQSKDGVDIDFQVVLLADDYEDFLTEAAAAAPGDVPELQKKLFNSLLPTASIEQLNAFRSQVAPARTPKQLLEATANAYRICNRVIVSDHGHGMTERDLKDIFLSRTSRNQTG
jgi:signal transduction histidine kinase